MSVPETPDVYARIAAVSADLCKDGISKSRKNAQQGYAFRGIDEVLNALSPILSKHGLVILPRILSRLCTERESKSGGTLFSVVVEAAFDFVAASDGSTHTVQTYGEAMDSADKATNKAMSAAYKYAAFLAFCIPTEGDNDADATTPEAGRVIASPVGSGAGTGPKNTPLPLIDHAQRKRFVDTALQYGWSEREVKGLLQRTLNVASTAEIPQFRFNELLRFLENGVEALHD